MPSKIKESVYEADLLNYPGPWAFHLPKDHLILVRDQDLVDLADPDRLVNLTLTYDQRKESLRQVCQRCQQKGIRTLILAFDQFFQQYRPGQGHEPRRLMPDMDEYIQLIARISKFAAGYGIGMELSILSPLEDGKAFAAKTSQQGRWFHYRKGLRDPETGDFAVDLWRQQRWANNKGAMLVEDGGVRAFAFNESVLGGTPYRVVDPASIIEVSDSLEVENYPNLKFSSNEYLAQRVRIKGTGSGQGRNRVLVVQQYITPEMDYFSPQALPFLANLVDRYADAGVKLHGLYADEMHIQQDWSYFSHHDHGEFALRYVSHHMEQAFAESYGREFRDLAPYMIYFVHGQEDFAADMSAKQDIMHVWGDTPEAVRQTALFRSRYYQFLQNGVVDLFTRAKRHAEKRAGHRLESRAHATWAESPTIDLWRTGQQPLAPHQYEYTSNFLWSDTVHQAAAACYDYFKWGDYLTGNGNDHCECGWLDRNYYGLMLACSTGILNDVPYSYAAHWGMPDQIGRRRIALQNVFGVAGTPAFGLVQDMQHRDVDVLMLYPLDLVAVDERFGSWVNQYAYANQVTAAKLLERGCVAAGAIEMAGRRFTTLVILFEPFPSSKLLALLESFVHQGGRLIWSGPPPVITSEGTSALSIWTRIMGVDYAPGLDEGLLMPGTKIEFAGRLEDVLPQIVLTDFLVDRIFPVEPQSGTEVVARCKHDSVGTCRIGPSGGTATYLGFRPRDDQSASLGYETRTWFDILSALGAYPATGCFPGCNDNTEHLSRLGPWVACRFPNGAIALAPHMRTYEEGWDGNYARKKDQDDKYLQRQPPPSENLDLEDYRVNGHRVTYHGRGAVTFRMDGDKNLIAFAGAGSRCIAIDGREHVFADKPMDLIAWNPVHPSRRPDQGTLVQVQVHGVGRVFLPAHGLPMESRLVVEGPSPGSRGQAWPSHGHEDVLEFEITAEISGQWIYVVVDGEDGA